MNLVGNLKGGSTSQESAPDPRNRPMYGRKGITIGQHLDEFDHFKDDKGRPFDQLVLSVLFGEAKSPTLPPWKPQIGKPGLPQETKVDIDNYIFRMKTQHLEDAQKRLIANPELKCKQEEEDAKGKAAKQKTSQDTTSTIRILGEGSNARKRPGVKRYI